MSVKKNFIYSILYQIFVIIMPLITTPYIARVIGPEGVGIQAYTFSVANYFVLFAMLGINNYGNRSIAMVRDDKVKLSKTFWEIYSLQVAMSLFMVILYWLYVVFIANELKTFLLIQMIYIIAACIDINWLFFGLEQFKLTVMRNAVIKLISVLSIFIFVKSSEDLFIYLFILALGNLISQLVLWKYINKYITYTRVSFKGIVKHIKPILILFIPVIAISIYKIMDKVMLASMSNLTQVGFYENSEKIINIPLGVIIALGTVMLPRMSNLQSSGNEEKSKKYIALSIEFVMFMAFGSIFGLIGVTPVLIPIFLDSKFIECIDIVALLSISILFLGWANVIRTQYLIPKKKDKIYITSTILGACTNLVVNLLLITKLGAIGAAIGTVFAEGVVAIYQTIMIRKELDILNYIQKTIYYIIPGIVMCTSVRLIGKNLGVSLLTGIIQIVVGGFIYVLLSCIYMIITKNELVINIGGKILHKINFIIK